MILFDTHALLWLMEGNTRLGRGARRLADRALGRTEAAVATISFWEIALLVAKARVALDRSPAGFRLQVLELGIREESLSGRAAVAAGELHGLHGDPVDRLIVATALEIEAMLVTADRRLLRWSGPLKTHDARH